MIRVAHLLPNMAIGGRERIVADLCRTAAAHGVEPVVIAYDPVDAHSPRRHSSESWGPARQARHRAARDPGVRWDDEAGSTIALPVHAPLIPLDRRRPDFASVLAATLTEHRIDIVHAQGHVAAALARPASTHLPTIATFHIALGEGWRWLPTIARGLRAADAVTAVSDDLARRYRWLAGAPIRTIATGVDLARFAPDRHRPPNAIFTIGIAARLHPVKRHIDAIAALRLLHAQGLLCRLRIAGDGPEAAAIRDAATDLDVELLGPVADMSAFLAGLDAFLLPSDHEGTPAALLEAMASGIPCVATAVGGVPALVDDAALLVPRRRPDLIADALARIASEPALTERLSRAGLARTARFSLERQAGSYAALYRTLLAEHRRKAA